MKKIVSWILFVLTVLTFAFDICFAVDGMIEVKNQLDLLAKRGASGHEYLGVPIDIVMIGVFVISLFGWILSLVSSKMAQCRVMKVMSSVLNAFFGLMMISCFLPFYL